MRMRAQEITEQLLALQSSLDLDALDAVCDEIEGREDGVQFLPALFAILENNPGADFGSPGVIVHTAERYFKNGYEQALLTSLRRHPTPHTVWMLNRVINAVQGQERAELVSLMTHFAEDCAIDVETRMAARDFLA